MKHGFTRLTPSHRIFIPRTREDREDVREMLRTHAYPYDDDDEAEEQDSKLRPANRIPPGINAKIAMHST